jgi:ParB-like chromosome segregation protein Spo0J
MLVDLNRIRVDSAAQARSELSQDVIACMEDDLRAGDTFPPIVLFDDGTGDYWLADGWHRYVAHGRVGKPFIEAETREGGAREAYLASLALNAKSQTLGIADKKRAAERMLRDPEWSQWSDREIGRRCGIDKNVVSRLKEQLSGAAHQMIQAIKTKEESMTQVPQVEQPAAPADIEIVDSCQSGTDSEPAQVSPPKKVKAKRGGKEYTIDTKNLGKRERKEDFAKAKGEGRVSLKAWDIMKSTPAAKEKSQKRALSKLTKSMQIEVAKRLRDGDSSTVADALDAITAGAPIDKWSKAYAAVMELEPGDRVRLCNQILSENARPLSVVR